MTKRNHRTLCLAALLALLAACSSTGGTSGEAEGAATKPGPSVTTTAPTTTTPAATTTAGPETGGSEGEILSYDDTGARQACTLLTSEEIGAQLGEAIGPPVPVSPSCQWRVGTGAMLALTVHPGQTAAGIEASFPGLKSDDLLLVGDAAFLSTHKVLYVQSGDATYALQLVRPGEWTDAVWEDLAALGQAIAGRSAAPVAPEPSGATPRTEMLDPERALGAGDPLRLWIGGDSLAAGPSWAIADAASSTGVADPRVEFQVGSGLARTDFFDWPAHLAAAADSYDPEIFVLLFGGNDNQALLANGETIARDDPRWSHAYRERIAGIMATLTQHGRRLVWIGPTPMREAGLNQRMRTIHEILGSEAALHPGVHYVDAWSSFSPPGQPGAYTDRLPDASGAEEIVRLDDGIHLNVAGSIRLAETVMHEIAQISSLPEP